MKMRKTPVTTSLYPIGVLCALLALSCMQYARKKGLETIRETPASARLKAEELKSKTAIKIADGLQISLWATDSLAPDPVAMSIDKYGRVYLTRTVRQKNSEFDIRGHQDWVPGSSKLRTVEDRRAFLRSVFAPEKSKQNEWLKDLNFDGSHDWRDLAVEKEEIWRLEDADRDGMADVSTRILADFHDEVSDIAAGLLVRDKDMFLTLAPDVWRLDDPNGDGIPDKKTSISHGYGVHIGFSGHNLSGPVEGPDGRIYWNIGDIGGTVTTSDGRVFENPNSGFIARANPDGSDFEIFATGLRNTHEFVFDEYGNLISSDNDGDHAGESERLVHVVEGSDAGWRSNWQYGKYTDPKNNAYKVWMDEKLYQPRWEGQAAYIIPPIMNYHNGPTGMVYNPGTALGSAWKNKFFLVEFVGTPSHSHIWSFGLKPKGASFALDGETDVLSGILPTAIQFGPDGALYAADWVTGWNTKNYGRVWKIDVSAGKNDLEAARRETQRLMLLDYAKQTPDQLYQLLFYTDMRIRQKAQFELARRGAKGLPSLQKAALQTGNQLARIHGVWGIGQLARRDRSHGAFLTSLLRDADAEIIAQAAKMLGDAGIASAGETLIALLDRPEPRVRFYAAEALGQTAHTPAVAPLIQLLKNNNDEDLYIRHAAVLALSRIGQVEPLVALANSPSKALRTAAVLTLRRLASEKVAVFLRDQDEYIATEAARAINDDLSIPAALPALAAVLNETRFQAEPLLRRAVNAAQRVGGERELDALIRFARRTDISETIRSEAFAAIGTWAAPSELDRVDGRYRGEVRRDPAAVQAKIKPLLPALLMESAPSVLAAVADMAARLQLKEAAPSLAALLATQKDEQVKISILKSLNALEYSQMESLLKSSMQDPSEAVRAASLGLLSDANVSAESLPAIASAIFDKGGVREQQQLLSAMSRLDKGKTGGVLRDLLARLREGKLSSSVRLELKEAIAANGSADLAEQLAAIAPPQSALAKYADALHGGNGGDGYGLFFYNSTAQCVRCHAVWGNGGKVGPDLTGIGSELTREQLLEAIVEPDARIAPGYGNVALTLKDGQQVYGVLSKETSEALTLTTSAAEPLVVPIGRIAKRENLPSGMPPMGESLSVREIRNIVEFLAGLKK